MPTQKTQQSGFRYPFAQYPTALEPNSGSGALEMRDIILSLVLSVLYADLLRESGTMEF